MVVCVYMNPTIDKTMMVKTFRTGEINRAVKVTMHGAGKAVTFGLVLKELGEENVKIMGLMYEEGKKTIQPRMDRAGIPYRFVVRPGSARVNVKIFDEEKQEITEVNESGEQVEADTLQKIKDTILEELEPGDYMVCSGSLPPGCPKSFYAELIAQANAKGVRCMLDADGEALALGIQQKPYLIKPNRYELETLYGEKIEGQDALLQACNRLIECGIGVVALSLGGEGAIITNGKQAYRANALKVQVRSTVAAGDSMAAGILYALSHQKSLETALRYGVAAATGTCMLEGTDLVTKPMFQELLEKVNTQII